MGDAAIDIRGLSFSYPANARALDDLHVRIDSGETVGIVGPNGAGKTTLFLCLAGVLDTEPGQIRVAGLDPACSGDRRQLPGRLGVVFANSDDQLFHASVFEDVAFGPLNLGLPADAVRERVAAALRQVGLTDATQRAPFQLSEGEKRRAALAGVLAMQPAILLLDEPSIFLDPRGRRELRDLLAGLNGTRLIASHDLEFVRATCRRVIVLDGGRLAADGPTDHVLANAELMDRHGLEVPFSLRT